MEKRKLFHVGYEMIGALNVELAINMSNPKSARGIIVLLKTIKKYCFARTTRKQFNGRFFTGML